MSFFKRLFSSDPATLVSKAERALEKGDAVQVLSQLDRLGNDVPDELRAQGAALAERAHAAIAEAASQRAEDFEDAGMHEQAIDSLTLALEHCREGELRSGLEARLAKLRFPDPEAELEAHEEHDEPAGESADTEGAYWTLVSMLKEEVAERYEERPESFRRALVDLNEARPDAALPVFEELVTASPDDPVGRLERGRCLLLLNRAEEAQQDFEAAWQVFGDEPLDAPGQLSLPLLWAETAMALKQPERLVEKVAGPGAADKGQPILAHLLAQALILLGRADDAAAHLKACVKAYPREAEFPQLLAEALVMKDDRAGAIEALETAIAPSCVGGGCRAPALHLPTVRQLVALILDEGGSTTRARELLELVQGSRRGKLGWPDLALLARCERQDGDEASCARLIEQARALVPAGLDGAHAQLDALAAAAKG